MLGEYGFHFDRWGNSDMFCEIYEGSYQILDLYEWDGERWSLRLNDQTRLPDDFKRLDKSLSPNSAAFPQHPEIWLRYVGSLSKDS